MLGLWLDGFRISPLSKTTNSQACFQVLGKVAMPVLNKGMTSLITFRFCFTGILKVCSLAG